LTALLQAWSAVDDALEKVAPRVHQELRRLAARYMAGERPNHLLQTTALINEAYIRRLEECSLAKPRALLRSFGTIDATDSGRCRKSQAGTERRGDFS
jgi:hypothetical protein